jgi:hypothetical protein
VLSEELAAAHYKLKSFRRETPASVAGAEREPQLVTA